MDFMDNLTVTLIANAGVLLELCGTTLLVDGIFRDECPFFDSPSSVVWAQMLTGQGIFHKRELRCGRYCLILCFFTRRTTRGTFTDG